jgi:hypothetical protein
VTDMTFPSAGLAGLVLGLATTQLDLDLSVGIYPLIAALIGLLWRLNSRLVAIETKFNVLDRVLERLVPGYEEHDR